LKVRTKEAVQMVELFFTRYLTNKLEKMATKTLKRKKNKKSKEEKFNLKFDLSHPTKDKFGHCYDFFKTALYDPKNYEAINNPTRFKRSLDRYFNFLESNHSDYFQLLSILNQSFGKEGKVDTAEAIFKKIFPFSRLKKELAKKISETHQVLTEVFEPN
jgi:hypothetical protein